MTYPRGFGARVIIRIPCLFRYLQRFREMLVRLGDLLDRTFDLGLY